MSKFYSSIRLFSQIILRSAACLVALFVFTAAASAATYTVDTTSSDAALTACTAAADDCSLRGAIARANQTPDNDTIDFALPAGRNTIFTEGELTINNAGALTITNSTEAINLRISGGGNSRVFVVNPGANLTLNAVTVRSGDARGNFGGGILNRGTATITNSIISGNTGSNGGGICNFDDFSTLLLINSTVSGNKATTTGPGGGGGGVFNDGMATITNSTISGNEVTFYDGGGIFNESRLTVTNSTVSGNSAREGGGIFNIAPATLNLTSVTVAFNSAVGGEGGGVKNYRATANLRNTIVGQNAAAISSADFEGAVASTSSFNLIGSGAGMTGIANGSGGNQVGIDPKLDPTLAPNGGTTANHALLPDSTAVDRGNDTGTTDQRGFFRPIDLPNYANATNGNSADIGAFEAQTTPPALPRTVDTNADDATLTACTAAPNDCSLRGAVSAANASPFPDSINFDDGITNITLTSQITINNAGSLSINGQGANVLTIDGGAGTNRIFFVEGAEVTIQGVTLSGGNGAGAAVNVRGGSGLILESVVVKDNSGLGAFAFGAISLQGTGVRMGVRIANSTISGNTDFTGCPAIYAVDGVSLNVINTTVSGNSTTATGIGAGGVCVWGNSSAAVRSTTISGNAGGSGGGGGGGINIQNTARVDLGNTIVAGNTSAGIGPDLYRFDDGRATFNSATGNVIGDNSGNPSAPNTDVFPTGNPNPNGDKVGTAGAVINPLLGQLGNNGGSTPTRALLAGSLAIDAGRNSLATALGLTTDQRGAARIIDGNGDGTATIDSGAFEEQFVPPPPADLTVVKSHAGNFTQGNSGKTYSITVSNSGSGSTSGTVSVVDTLPSGLTATAITGAGWTCNLATLTCTRSDALAAAGSYPAITLTVNVANDAPASVTNTASVSGGGEINTANNTASDVTTVNGVADLTVVKSHAGNFTRGDTGKTYSITVTNSGTGATSGTISVVDSLPSGLTATAISGTGWTCAFATLTCTRSDALAAAGSYPAITLTVNVASDAPSSVTNTATVSGGGETNTANNRANDVTGVNAVTTYTVDTIADNAALTACTTAANDCSLRGAIARANATINNDSIGFNLPASSTITLTNGEIIINDAATAGALTITNPTGASNLLISGNNASRVFSVYPGANLTLNAITVTRGNTSGGGGGIINYGTTTLLNSAVSGNTAGAGGGIYNFSGAVSLTHSTVSGNTGQTGGGFYNEGGTATILNSTISGNTASATSGGLHNASSGTLTLLNSTVSGNKAQNGGGIFSSGTLNLTSVTVAYNIAQSNVAGGVYIANGTANLLNTIVAKNSAFDGPDFFGAIAPTSSFNLIGDDTRTTGITNGTNGNQVGTAASPINPQLDSALALNGGTTLNHALQTGSPAIDKGSATGTDQRGLRRPVDLAAYANATGGNGSDIGAYEEQAGTLTPFDLTVVKSHAGNFTQGDTGMTYSITVTNSSGGKATSETVSVTDSLPAGLMATAISGAGWNCNFSNLTCTRNDTLAAGASFPAITLTVNVANNAPASVTNRATVSGGGETNTANNTATDPTTINAAAQYAISGTIRYGITEAGQTPAAVSGVNLNLTGTAAASPISDGSGVYQLSNLAGGSYTVTPTKTGDIKGINSLDATRIQQHLVGLTTLTANQLIAADTDGSGTVNSLDATRIQQRAVGITSQNIIGQWKFVPANRQYNALSSNQSNQDYQAVLVGEVSGNWATASSFADDSSTDEQMLPKQDNLIDVVAGVENEITAQIAEQMKQSADLKASDSQTETATAEGVAVNVSLPTNAKAATGTFITIPVSIGPVVAGSSIESIDFTVFYNPAVLQPTATVGSSAGTLSNGCSVLPNSPISGRVIVSGACAQAITSATGGVLYNLQFTVLGAANQTSVLTFVNSSNNINTFQFNNGTPSAATNTGQFTVFAPTAASVSVSGRVMNDQGRGIRNVTIILTDSNGNQRTAQTTSFGYYDFSNIEAGETVTITAKARRFQFLQSTIVRTTNQSVTDADFVSEP